MKIKYAIIRDLRAGPSTADAIAERINASQREVERYLRELMMEGLVKYRMHQWMTIYYRP